MTELSNSAKTYKEFFKKIDNLILPILFGIFLSSFSAIAKPSNKFLNDTIGYVNLSDVSQNGIEDTIIKSKRIKYLIVDLRDYHDQHFLKSMKFLEKILPKKSLLFSLRESLIGPKEFFTYKPILKNKKMKFIVIINRSTSGGGELIAGNIQDYELGISVGDTTAGNFKMLDKNLNVIGKTYLPSGRDISRGIKISEYKTKWNKTVLSGLGIIPDFQFDTTNDEKIIKKAIELSQILNKKN